MAITAEIAAAYEATERPTAYELILGDAAWHALMATCPACVNERAGFAMGLPFQRTDEFPGWELRPRPPLPSR